MFTLFVVFSLIAVFLSASLAHYASKANHLESLVRNSRKLTIAREKNAQEWKEYAERLETELAAMRTTAANMRTTAANMQNTLYDQLAKIENGQFMLPVKTNGAKLSDPIVIVHGKRVKLSSLEVKTPQQTTTAPIAASTAIATVSPQDDHERNLAAKWQDQGKSAEWINSQLANIQAGKAKKNAAKTN